MAKSAAERAREKAQKMKAMRDEKEKELKSKTKTMEEVKEGLKVVKDESETLATNETKKEEEKPKPEAKKEGSEIEIVRDGLLIPRDELETIVALRGRAFSLGVEATKTEIYRAGLQALASLSDPQLKKTIGGLQKVKTGRKPKK